MIEAHWNTHCKWLQEHLPEAYESLNAPANAEAFEVFKAQMGYEMPEELKRLYALNNGQDQDCLIGVWWGLPFIPIEHLLEFHLSTTPPIDLSAEDSSYPKQAIKLYDRNPLWIPFAEDGAYNYLAVDLDPDVKGRVGQIINMGNDERNKYVLAESLEQFLSFMNQEIAAGHYIIETDPFGDTMFHYKGTHPIDDLTQRFSTTNN